MERRDIDSLDNRDPEAMERFAKWAERTLVRWFRYELAGTERVPEGGALYVGNHSSAVLPVDALLLGVRLYRDVGMDAVPYGLAHEVALNLPLLNQVGAALGAVRASHRNAERLFGRGYKVLVFPGGETDALRPHRRRNEVEFDGRKGYVRLALRAGVPIVPVATAGAHSTLYIISDNRWLARKIRADRWLRAKVFPLSVSIPWGITLGPPPPHLPLPTRILAEVLEPITFEHTGADAARDEAYVATCDALVRRRLQHGLDRLVESRRQRGGFFGTS